MNDQNEREEFYSRAIYIAVFGIFGLVMALTGLLAWMSPELFFPVR